MNGRPLPGRKSVQSLGVESPQGVAQPLRWGSVAMKTIASVASFALAAASLLASAAASAQGPDPDLPAPSAPEAAPAEAAVPLPQCRLSEHSGFDDADARTASLLVCANIARAGASPSEHFRVSLGKLGSVVILSVAAEGSVVGSTIDSREMRLAGIEEVEQAAPRIAQSIVHGTPVAETEKVDNLVGGETRQPQSKGGKTHFAMGLAGLFPPLDQGAAPAPGLVLDIHYETGNGRLELGGAFRGGGGSANDQAPSMGFVMFSVGGRYFTSDADVSPYVGGGLSWGYLNLKVPAQNVQADNSGLGAYADAGVQILRTHKTHLSFGARLDMPFFALNSQTSSSTYDPVSGNYTTPTKSSFYYAPLSLELRLTF